MTEFWVSGKNKWCEYCKCWLKDTIQSWAVHERGAGHQENVTRKLREMRQTADREKRDEVHLAAAMNRVEQEAEKRYAADKRAEDGARKARLGEWEWNEGSGYYYNAVHRWYYDKNTGMYYGGEPVVWTDKPTMPREARYEVMHKPPPLPPPTSGPPGTTAAAGGGGGATQAARQGAAGGQQYAVAGSRVVANKHPLSQVGGYQLHSIGGAVGGAKGVGISETGRGGGSSAAGAAAGDPKRKRDGGAAGSGGGGKELSKEDAEFLARREAARQRVNTRTASSFGLT